MISTHRLIRVFYAHALIMLMAVQWLAGSIYLKNTYLIEVTSEMNANEQRIADALMDIFGFRTDVALVDSKIREQINLLGYAAPFVHTIEMHGEVNAFTLENHNVRFQEIELMMQQPGGTRNDQENSTCLERLFVKFCFGEHPYLPAITDNVIDEKDFPLNSMHDLCSHSCPSPPPWHV